jgi:hypothetical protein
MAAVRISGLSPAALYSNNYVTGCPKYNEYIEIN